MGGPNDTFDAAFGANTGTHRKSLIRDTENVKKWKKDLWRFGGSALGRWALERRKGAPPPSMTVAVALQYPGSGLPSVAECRPATALHHRAPTCQPAA
jgi:hypothetical protein